MAPRWVMSIHEITAFLEATLKGLHITFFQRGYLLQTLGINVVTMADDHVGKYNIFERPFPSRAEPTVSGTVSLRSSVGPIASMREPSSLNNYNNLYQPKAVFWKTQCLVSLYDESARRQRAASRPRRK